MLLRPHHITRTPPSAFFLHQYSLVYQVLYVAEGGVLAGPGHFGLLVGGELVGYVLPARG